MTLDERLRTELRAIEPGPLREEEALDCVLRKHARGLALRRVTRQALAAAVIVSLFASVAMVVAWRNSPENTGAASSSDGYRSTTTIRLATSSGAKELATAPQTIKTALHAAHLPVNISHIDFRATLDPARRLLTLTVTAPTQFESEAVTQRWAAVFVEARRNEAVDQLRASNRALDRKVNRLLERLRSVNAELIRIDPTTFNDRNLRYSPNSHSFTDKTSPAPPVPEQGSTHELNLANERVQILTSLGDLSAQSARARIANLTPGIAGTVIAQTRAVRVHTSSPSRTAPVLVGWAIGLLVVFAAAVLVFRRRTRRTGQVAA